MGVAVAMETDKKLKSICCPFDGKPCDCPVPRGFTACLDCPRFGKV